ncbi:MAG: PilZ domain-containing protein [Peptococcaceae bacterium]|nr:PilZ domain-containing protein [Peptococcaceae bacterium]
MEKIKNFLLKLKPAAAVLSLQLFAFARPCLAGTTFHDVSRSITDAFSGRHLFSVKNIAGFALTVLFFVLVFQVFRLSWLKKEKESSRRGRVKLRPLDPQRKRKWYRLRTDLEFKWIPAGDAGKRPGQYKTDRLEDISGGGLCFKTGKKLNPGDEIRLVLDLEGGRNLAIPGRVLRVEEETGQADPIYKVAVEFENLPGIERERVVSYITKIQRHYIQNKRRKYTPPSS